MFQMKTKIMIAALVLGVIGGSIFLNDAYSKKYKCNKCHQVFSSSIPKPNCTWCGSGSVEEIESQE